MVYDYILFYHVGFELGNLVSVDLKLDNNAHLLYPVHHQELPNPADGHY